MITKFIGIAAGFFLGVCGLIPAVRTWYEGASIGTPISAALPILIGVVLMFIYLCAEHGFDLIVIGTYTVEIGSWAVIVWFHFRPRKPITS